MNSQKNYNLLIGVAALVAILLVISIVGYIVSRPKPIVIQGEAEATEYRISGKVPGRIEAFRGEEGQMDLEEFLANAPKTISFMGRTFDSEVDYYGGEG